MRYFLLSLLFVIGCASGEGLTVGESIMTYKADMKITVDGSTFDGIAVTEIGKEERTITINVVSHAKLDALYIRTCGRFNDYQKINPNWYGGAGKTFVYQYKPIGMEKSTACPLFIEAYDLTNALAAWGMVAFRDGNNLPTSKYGAACNGTGWTFKGLTGCQTQAGLFQSIEFDSDVKFFEQSETCNLKKESARKFSYRPAQGVCVATFSDGSRRHKLIAIGFKRPLLRE